MAWLKRKPDPISERERALNQEIAALEAQIKKLGAEARPNDTRRQSSPVHDEQGIIGLVEASPPRNRTPQEPIFEEVDLNVLTARNETPITPEHYNELGVRKYDLPALFRRMRNNFRGPSTTNPKLVSYLAAGGI